jgi:hydrogenase maturation protease
MLDRRELAQLVRRSGRISAHEAGLADLLSMVALEGFAPKNLALLAIQPQTIDWGETLSPAVAQAALQACQLALETGRAWISA